MGGNGGRSVGLMFQDPSPPTPTTTSTVPLTPTN